MRRHLACWWLLAGMALYLPAHGAGPLVAVVVNDTLAPLIQDELNQYRQDLVAEGYSVTITAWTLAGSTPVQLKNYLISQQPHGLAGAMLVGDLPIALYYHANDFYGAAVTFACDLYYMNLNSTWTDSNSDGKFDTVSGDSRPQIWVSRVVASNLPAMGTVEDLVKNYFAKNHAYRTQAKTLPRRACAMIYTSPPHDNGWPLTWANTLGLAYTNYEAIGNPDFTSTTYRAKLAAGYEFMYLCAHSSASRHAFENGSYYNSSIPGDNPKIWFYNLYACSNCDYTYSNNMGSCYITTADYGLVACGSTKTGGMLSTHFYMAPLGDHKSFGEAFKDWWQYILSVTVSDSTISWYYGMVLLGDGTLTISPQNALATATLTPSPSFTPSPTSSFTPRPSLTPSPTPTLSPTASPTSKAIMATVTPTCSVTVTPSQTITPATTPGPAVATGRTLLAYPNPAKGLVFFHLLRDPQAEAVLSIYNMAGERISTMVVPASSSAQITVTWTCNQVAAGLYLVRLTQHGREAGRCKVALIK